MSGDSYEDKVNQELGGYIDLDTGVVDVRLGGEASDSGDRQEDRRKLASVLLHNQPFGFTHEDIEELRGEARYIRVNRWQGWEPLESLADRIEALLPPRKESP